MLVTRHEETIEAIRSFERQHRVRLHAMLLLASAGLGGLLVSRLLLHWGLHVPFLRFPIAVLVSYGLFLLLVDAWLWFVGRGITSQELVDLLPRGSRVSSRSSGMSGKGGSFDGGGASASFEGPATPLSGPSSSTAVGGPGVSPLPAMAAMDANVAANANVPDGGFYASVEPASGAAASTGTTVPGDSSSSGSSKGGGDLFAIIVFLVVLVACIGAVGWVITATPGILVETAVEAGVASGMIRGAAPQRGATWFTSLCERTWRKAGLLVLLAVFLGVAVRMVDPQADTIGEAIARTLKYRL